MALSILVVDDEPALRVIAAGVLRDEGWYVRVAGDGIQALECIDQAMPDVLVLDLDMPRLDGEGVLAGLAGRGCLEQLRIIIASGSSARARAIPFPVLHKPYDLDHLVELVRPQQPTS